jgi:hypothetical protein
VPKPTKDSQPVEPTPDREKTLQTLMDIMQMQEIKNPTLRDKQARLLQMLKYGTLNETSS